MPTITIQMPDLINLRAAAKLLGVSRPTVYSLIAQGKLHPVQIDDRQFLERAEVERVRAERTQQKRK